MSTQAALTETYGAALERGAAALRMAGVEQARRDARLLLAAAGETSVEQVFGYPERPLDPVARQRFDGFLQRRAAREPVSRVLGRREFWGLEFVLAPATLDPRPDSELLVETLVEELAADPGSGRDPGPVSILDLGTGSGCLLLALLSALPKAWGVGLDLSPEAVAVARNNARRLGLADRAGFAVGDWTAPIGGIWKAIVSNPPYIKESEISDLAPEVRLYEPQGALAGGPDGLAAYRSLAPGAAKLLAPDGVLALEVGADQAQAVAGLLRASGFGEVANAPRPGGESSAVSLRKVVEMGQFMWIQVGKKWLESRAFPTNVTV